MINNETIFFHKIFSYTYNYFFAKKKSPKLWSLKFLYISGIIPTGNFFFVGWKLCRKENAFVVVAFGQALLSFRTCGTWNSRALMGENGTAAISLRRGRWPARPLERKSLRSDSRWHRSHFAVFISRKSTFPSRNACRMELSDRLFKRLAFSFYFYPFRGENSDKWGIRAKKM